MQSTLSCRAQCDLSLLCDQLIGMQGISTSVLQEYMHNLEGRKGQVSPYQMYCVFIWRCD